MPDHSADARRIVDSNVYMTLATADADGCPWASPVWFAHDDYTRLLWVSKPEARHSQNLAVRSQAAVVIFDSTVAEGEAGLVAEEDEERYIGVVSRRSEAFGWPSWSVEDVRSPARLRLYAASPSAQFVLGPGDERIAVELA